MFASLQAGMSKQVGIAASGVGHKASECGIPAGNGAQSSVGNSAEGFLLLVPPSFFKWEKLI